MAQQPSPVRTVQNAVTQLIADYELGLYDENLHQVAQEAVKEALNQKLGDNQIIANAKQALRDRLTAWKKDEIPDAKLGGMQLYKIWSAKCINGKEWLFYPEKDSTDPHVAWVVGSQEVHVKFDGRNQQPVSIYYNAQLVFHHVGKNGADPTSKQRQEADNIIQNWRVSMQTQANQRRAIDGFLS